MKCKITVNLLSSIGGREGCARVCSSCRGQGIQLVSRQIAPHMVQRMQQLCGDCCGKGELLFFMKRSKRKTMVQRRFTGEIINEHDQCRTCLGKKTVEQKKNFEVTIAPGLKFVLTANNVNIHLIHLLLFYRKSS